MRTTLRVLREHGEWKSPANAMFEHTQNAICHRLHRQTHALIVGVAQPDGEAAPFHLRFEIEDAEGFHAVRRNHAYSSCTTPMWRKPEGLDEGDLHF